LLRLGERGWIREAAGGGHQARRRRRRGATYPTAPGSASGK